MKKSTHLKEIPKGNYTYEELYNSIKEADFDEKYLKKVLDRKYKAFPEFGINKKDLDDIIWKVGILEKNRKSESDILLDEIFFYHEKIMEILGKEDKRTSTKIKRGIYNFTKGFLCSAQNILSSPFCIPTKIRRFQTGLSNLEKELFAPINMETGCKNKYFDSIDGASIPKPYEVGTDISRWGIGASMVLGAPFAIILSIAFFSTMWPVLATLGVTNTASLIYESIRMKKTKEQIEANKY